MNDVPEDTQPVVRLNAEGLLVLLLNSTPGDRYEIIYREHRIIYREHHLQLERSNSDLLVFSELGTPIELRLANSRDCLHAIRDLNLLTWILDGKELPHGNA